jgi:uncharacterized damage-inducible protein DinB
MKETTQQYIQRIVGNLDGKDPLKIQKNTAKKLHKVIKPLNKKELKRRPAADKWSIAEILAHLADAELVAGWRLRLILSSDGVPIQAFDQEAWAKTFSYEDRDANESLRAFKFLREMNLALLKSVPRKLWENHGMHAERGKETVTRLLRLYAGHDVNHVRQVEEIAKGKKAKKAGK